MWERRFIKSSETSRFDLHLMHLQAWGFEFKAQGFESYAAFESFALEGFESLSKGFESFMWMIQISMLSFELVVIFK